jgi:hypothetical protein
MENTCILCNYTTKDKYNFSKHLQAKSHKNKEELNKYCTLCDKYFQDLKKYKYHLYNVHKKTKNKITTDNIKKTDVNTKKKKIDNNKKIDLVSSKLDITNDKIDAITNSNKIITNEIINVKDKINESNRMVAKAITKASSLIKYLMENHSTTPPLKKISEQDFMDKLRLDFNCKYTEKNKYCLERELVKQYKNATFVKNISQLILKLVNHNDHEKQPIYNTDCARNNYVIKTSAVWNEDKAGIKFAEYVIKPLLNHIRKLIIAYRRNHIEKCDISKYSLIEHEIHANTYDNTLAFEDELYDDSLIRAILNELSPYLRYLKKEIEDLEKFNQLEKLQEDLKDIIHNSDISDNSEDNDDTNNNNDVNGDDNNDNSYTSSVNNSDDNSSDRDSSDSSDSYNNDDNNKSSKKDSNYKRMIKDIKEKYKYKK